MPSGRWQVAGDGRLMRLRQDRAGGGANEKPFCSAARALPDSATLGRFERGVAFALDRGKLLPRQAKLFLLRGQVLLGGGELELAFLATLDRIANGGKISLRNRGDRIGLRVLLRGGRDIDVDRLRELRLQRCPARDLLRGLRILLEELPHRVELLLGGGVARGVFLNVPLPLLGGVLEKSLLRIQGCLHADAVLARAKIRIDGDRGQKKS